MKKSTKLNKGWSKDIHNIVGCIVDTMSAGDTIDSKLLSKMVSLVTQYDEPFLTQHNTRPNETKGFNAVQWKVQELCQSGLKHQIYR